MSLKYTVSMAYIEKLFQMETWQENFDLKNNKTFHVSRDGAVSIDLNCFTTMNRSEEIRVAKEEEEEESLTDSEPTAKKRDKRKGVGREDPEGPMPRLWPGKNSGRGRLNKEAGRVEKGQIAEVKKASAQEVKPLSDRITRSASKRSRSRRGRKSQVNQS